MINIETILLYDCFAPMEEEDKMLARFDGLVIKNRFTDYVEFDEDVFRYIKDRRIISCFLAKYTIIGDYNLDIPFDKLLNDKQKGI